MNNETPILGVNSDPTRRSSALLNKGINFDQKDTEIPKLIEDLNND